MKQYGQYISLLRTRLGYTQKEFAHILCCDQGTISKIESGFIHFGEIIHHIAWKFGVHPKDFLGTKVEQLEEYYYVSETKQYIRYLINKRDYKSMVPYVKEGWKNSHFHGEKDLVFLHWSQGIIDIHFHHNPSSATEQIEQALKLTLYCETLPSHIEVLNSYGIIHFITNDLEAALFYFQKAQHILSALPHSLHPQIRTRVLYNLSNVYFQLEQYHHSERMAFQAIQLCKESKSTYLRGEVTYQYGCSSYHLGLKEKAKQYMEKSVIYFLDEEQDALAKQVIEILHKLF